ncbi:hypothetical protein DFJ73DRAFT_782819 [Zopfochytrium polystomum]|nr:hypothetical protein DFJ73DRAFT_782819 [Zopfochytrium polystomum]
MLNEREVTTAGFSVTIWWGGVAVEQFSKTCNTGGGVRPFAPPEPLLLVPFGVTALPPQEARRTGDLARAASPTGREPFSLRAERALQVLWEGSTRFKYIYFDTKAAAGCIVARNGWRESDAAVVFAANEAGDDLDVQPITSASTLQLCHADITPRPPMDRIVHMPSQSIALLEKGTNAPFSVDLYNWDDLASAEKEGPPQPQWMTLDFGRDINIASVSPMQMDATRLFCWSRWRTPSTASTHRRPVDNAFHQLRSVALVDVVRRRVLSAPLSSEEDFDFFVVVEDARSKADGGGTDVRREMRCYLVKAPESGVGQGQ